MTASDGRNSCKRFAQGGRRPLYLLGLLSAAAALTFALISACSTEPRARNIILISIDTLRADGLGCTGYLPEGKSPSPFIDSLAQKGALFTQAVSTSPWTLPGHYAMLTGLPNELHEVVDDRVRCRSGIKTLAAFLKESGYATAGFFSAPYLHKFFGFDQGFDQYEPCMNYETMYDVMEHKGREISKDERKQLIRTKEAASHRDITSEAVTDKSAYMAGKKRDSRLFLFLHYFDVHNDYIPPAPFNRRFQAGYTGWVDGSLFDPRINEEMAGEDLDRLRALYDGETAWVDHNLKRLFEQLNKTNPGLLEESIVVITSDHGEEFLEHGKVGHRGNCYATSLRIPLIIYAPGLIDEGIRVDDPVRIYDILPTLMDLANLPIPDQVYGRSLKPLMAGRTLPPAPIMSELTFIPAEQPKEYHKHFAFQVDRMKLIGFQKQKWSMENPIDFTGDLLGPPQYELYHLGKDPEEKDNLFEKEPKAAETMLKAYVQEVRRLQTKHRALHGQGQDTREAVPLPDGLQEQLDQLGYGK